MKLIKRLFFALVLVLIVAGAIVYFNLNRILRSTIETQATNSLNLDTKLGGARLAIFGGKLSLSDLQIASPKGYNAPQMFTLGGTDVAVSYGQLRSDPVRISQIIIDRPNLVLERKGEVFNIQALMNQGAKPTDSGSGGTPATPMKLIIDDLQLNNATVRVRPGIPGLNEEYLVTVPSVELKNIGNADNAANGAAVKDVVMQVVTALADKATSSGGLPGQLQEMLKINVGDLTKNLEKQLDKTLGKDLGNTITNITKDGGKNVKPEDVLGGLMGGGKKDKDKKPAQ